MPAPSGLRILAGPFCTARLAGAGAEVIKVDSPGGDHYGRAGPVRGEDGACCLLANADASMNVLQAAQALAVHPNTVYARVQRIHDITGRDARSFHDPSELLIVAECLARE